MAKTKWTEAMVETMLKILHEQVLHGERAENGFKKKAWISVKDGLRAAYQIDLEASQLKTKWANIKKDYDIYTAIKSNSGFGWDDYRAIPTAPDSVWNTYLKAHPEAEKFRKRGLMHYDILHELCANLSATGEYALTSNLSFRARPSFKPSQPPESQASNPAIRRPADSEKEFLDEGGGGQYVPIGDNEDMGVQEKEKLIGEESTVEAGSQSGEGVESKGKEKRKWGKMVEQDSFDRGSNGEEERDAEGLPTLKKVKRERNTTGRAIAQALDRLGETAQKIQRPTIELAVERLQQEYSSLLTTDELVKAFLVMESEVKASIFISLYPGEARDSWLREAICKL